jgi:hypothetical protein
MNNRSYENSSILRRENASLKLKYVMLGFVFEIPILWNIFGSHVKRLGWARVMFGGSSMYLSLPFFIVAHATGLAFLIQCVLTPLFTMNPRRLRNYIVIDRYKIAGLTMMDRINCTFCGYANGSIHFLNVWLGDLAITSPRLKFRQKFVAGSILILYIPLIAILQVITLHIVYELLVARPLGLSSMTKIAGIRRLNVMDDFNQRRGTLFMRLLRWEKLFAIRMAYALAQIESSWCPLKHLDRGAEVSYPQHHANFFEPDQVDEMLETLAEHGTAFQRRR